MVPFDDVEVGGGRGERREHLGSSSVCPVVFIGSSLRIIIPLSLWYFVLVGSRQLVKQAMSDYGDGDHGVEGDDEISEITMHSSSSGVASATTIPTASSRTSNVGVWAHAKKREGCDRRSPCQSRAEGG